MLRDRVIAKDASIIEALKKMDELDRKLLIVLENELFYGLLSVGDIQRAIIQNEPLDTKVYKVLRKNIRIAKPDESLETIKQWMLEFRTELYPVVDESRQIIKVYFWEDVFNEKKPQPKHQFNIPVVIMAGGTGSRLKPITNVLPKPLIPIGEKTMLEHIFDRFASHGCADFYLSVNYKADLIEYYITNQNLPYNINFFRETKPLGTAGSLSLLSQQLKETFFVSNCDIIIEQDYSEILDYHKSNKNDITIVAALKHYPIPYGTLETSENGVLLNLLEKPEFVFKINSGMYILEPQMIDEIPEDVFFHITHLIENVKNKGGKVGVFPVSEKSWIDIGEWDEYLKNKY